MPFRLYLVPVVGTAAKTNPRRPKYFQSDANGAGVVGIIDPVTPWSAAVYGFEAWAVVGATLSTSDDNLIIGQADGMALPFDLAPNLTAGQVTSVKNKLEAANIPAGWVTTSLSWLLVVRTVLGMCLFLLRYGATYADTNGVTPGTLFNGGRTLNSTFGSWPPAVQAAFVTTAQSFGISTAGLTASTTMRVILKAMADTFQSEQYDFSGTLI